LWNDKQTIKHNETNYQLHINDSSGGFPNERTNGS
jgi:hypothetical protein